MFDAQTARATKWPPDAASLRAPRTKYRTDPNAELSAVYTRKGPQPLETCGSGGLTIGKAC